ncbi:uncharacterized protein KQ657_002303 [Scheffersomyces spartinae]|uniref:Rho-GTPase-activating protein RGD2 n=1 Tax=Scheffersomyces spartinae TaxID=45513 RepID=A0A9P8AKH7_9ASCO|nr:uncharacterized protein KQ657_002303 [Scheffersomyces spartinae]KAG7195917.1 hypothetical protein KQ657_002303 [Scheffersomyces spartinae]
MSFADSFWCQDYELGFLVLFNQLEEGIKENEDFVELFRRRMELENAYGNKLLMIQGNGKSSRQKNDDFVSTIKNAYEKITEAFSDESEFHLQVGSNIDMRVIQPFSRWCLEHKQRVDYSKYIIFDKVREFKNAKANVERTQKKYFAKCKLLGDFKSQYTEEEINDILEELELAENEAADETIGEDEEEQTREENVWEIGPFLYTEKELGSFLSKILDNIPLKDHKVPILGVYQHVCSGNDLAQYLLENVSELKMNISKVEDVGQSLVDYGFLRIIGSMNNKFFNSSSYYYQWKPLAFERAGKPLPERPATERSRSSSVKITPTTTSLSNYLEDVKEAMGVTKVDFTDKTQLGKLTSDVKRLDAKYYEDVVKLDHMRCSLEELIIDHLTFMQKCELDRLRAIKKVVFDFISVFSVSKDKSEKMINELALLEETIHPANDLKLLIENYATGKFKPQVILYENYDESEIKQTFGVDLSSKARIDKKVVPLIVQAVLSHLDKIYPEMENDQQRLDLWTNPIGIAQVHTLRFEVNAATDINQIRTSLEKFPPIVVTNLLKLYLMELPDSIIPSKSYDLIKLLYTNHPANDPSQSEKRMRGLQNVLVNIPKSNLATLDALLTHLKRLIGIIGSANKDLATELQTQLAKEFGNLINRPLLEFVLNSDPASKLLNEKHQFTFVNELFDEKETIFQELRRLNSQRKKDISRSNSNSTREEQLKLNKTSTPSRTTSIVSKTRLESKLQSAVNKSLNVKKLNSSPPVESDKEEKDDGGSRSPSRTSTPLLLKRSTSPNKKKLNSMLLEDQ